MIAEYEMNFATSRGSFLLQFIYQPQALCYIRSSVKNVTHDIEVARAIGPVIIIINNVRLFQ
ncbi:hypothetical protein D3C71_1910300 [compost metagenome]